MKALILGGKVVDTAEVEFEVHESMTWMDCSEDCNSDWTLENGVLTAPAPYVDTRTYAELRAEAYPSLTEQADMAYWDRQNNTTTLDDAISAVKTTYPKPGV
jgi:hypothetical protein